jgi:phosphatidylcholine synthase
MHNSPSTFTKNQYMSAWAVHLFTASAAFFGILSLHAIYQHRMVVAFWFMAFTVFVDAVDGTFARKLKVKLVLPNIDGALLDNIVDFLNYVVVPCFFLLVQPNILPPMLTQWLVAAICITSSYQFCQSDAKTPDHFFKGFPSYWNFAIFYMFIFGTAPWTNAFILIGLCILVFVPIKYVYPSRLDYLTPSRQLKLLMHLCSACFGLSTLFILWNYPTIHPFSLGVSMGYIALYLGLSIYRTFFPLETRWG